ncbi:hypothetical protein KQI63_08965 [bacterium]|nr:hypothetical protein [bacterium]
MNARTVVAMAVMMLMMVGTQAQAKSPRGERPPRAPRPAVAPDHQRLPGHSKLDRMIELGLSDSQILEIDQVRQDHMEKVLPLKRELHDLMEQKRELGEDASTNRDKIVQLSKKLGDIQADLEGLRIDLITDAKKVLSDEQLEKLGDRELFGMHKGGRFPHGPRRGQQPPPPPDSPEPHQDQR